MAKLAYLGAGTWGIALASILAEKGHEVFVWTREEGLMQELQQKRVHPKLPHFSIPHTLRFTSDLAQVFEGADGIVESVTSSGIRPVFEKVCSLGYGHLPMIVTSKGIEQGTGLLLPEVIESLQEETCIGVLSGPSHAEEVVRQVPTSVVCSSKEDAMMEWVRELFTTQYFRIYPNADLRGVCFGGAMKNIIAIACGISDGLGGGDNTKAALMTRGLHEIRKLCFAESCKMETLNGLSGLGDLCVTCMSVHSRNYRYGKLIAEGFSPEGARQKIGMAVEGIYSCVSARELGQKWGVPLPITEATYAILYEGLDPREAVKALLTRAIKEEHL